MSCSIIIPTYNRKKFSRLISQNIRIQTYPNILEVIVADDGDESQRLEIKVP
jgi:glycosyltransferase involved in cell wall biosynthesis